MSNQTEMERYMRLALEEAMLAFDAGEVPVGAVLYVTMEPCAMCAGACVNAKLGRLVFGAFDEVAGCCGSKMDLTDHCFLHGVETWGGILESECKALLSRFFQALR